MSEQELATVRDHVKQLQNIFSLIAKAKFDGLYCENVLAALKYVDGQYKHYQDLLPKPEQAVKADVQPEPATQA